MECDFTEINIYLGGLFKKSRSKRRRAMRSVNWSYLMKRIIPYLNNQDGFNIEIFCGDDGTFAVDMNYLDDAECYADLNGEDFIGIIYQRFHYFKTLDTNK